MVLIQDLSYSFPNKETLFSHINLSLNPQEKVALIGNNGTGKSTLLRIIAQQMKPSAGQISLQALPYYVPQHFGQFNDLTLAEALGIDKKLIALKSILDGNTSEENFHLLNDDWTIEERCEQALNHWNLQSLDLFQSMASLSGGQKTKVFLAGIDIHQPDLILLDEPSNHLDLQGRQLLYDWIIQSSSTIIVVSHDRKLLNLLNTVCELSPNAIRTYGGNYDFYTEQKSIEINALYEDIQNKEKALRKAKETERESIERQMKLNSRGKNKQEKAGVAKIMMNTLRNKAEQSTAKLKSIHEDKLNNISQELQDLRNNMGDIDKMKFGFDNSSLHKGKILFKGTVFNYSYHNLPLWPNDLTMEIASGDRIALKGPNGSGKTTLIKIILGEIQPRSGTIHRAINRSLYIDQDYSLLNNNLKVYEQAQQFNNSGLQEHEIKIRLSRFLFTKEDWDKSCSALSGGERMRLILCCLTISNQSPDMIILDEPTNNLDIQNIEILTAAINQYDGTLVAVSHDQMFLETIRINRQYILLHNHK
jgi:ATPase subunit of ABC transporter with duplicated ATPase domains